MPPTAVVYILLATVFLLFLSLSRTPHAGPTHRPGRRQLASGHHAAFDPLVGRLERRIEERGVLPSDLKLHADLDSLLASWRSGALAREIEETGEYFGEEGRVNITERLTYLFPLLDRWPNDGKISFQELEAWNLRQAIDRLAYRTERQMLALDSDGDGAVTLREYLFRLSDEELESNNMAHGQAGWWKEQFNNADLDGNGSLNRTEFNDFLHPEDSSNPKIKMWLQKEKIREMDHDKDGKLSYVEFYDRAYDIHKNYAEFESDDNENPQNVPNPEEKFAELDVNKDEFLTMEELKPIIHHLHPGELSYATYYTKYLMHEADDDKDGTLTLKEMFDHYYAFYSTVVGESSLDDDVDEDDYHEELR